MAFEYLEQYKTFESVAEMDQHVEQHIQQHYFDLTESERAIVFVLSQRSLMYPGACHLKAETIANALEISTKTVYRSVKKLVELNIIEKLPGTKLNGIKGANIYKILPFDSNVPTEVSQRTKAEKPYESKAEINSSEKQPSNSFNQEKDLKDINTYAMQSSAVDKDELLVVKEKTPYRKLREFIEYFSDDKKLAYKMYGIYIAQTKRQINKPSIDIAIEAVKHTFNALKRKTVHSITGYFNNTLKGLLDKFYEAEVSDLYEMDSDVEFVNGNNTRGPDWLYW